MAKRKHVYRIGDKIRILVPRVVERVGYPKEVFNYLPDESNREVLIAERLLRGISLEEAVRQVDLDLDIQSKWGERSSKIGTVHPKVAWTAAYLRAKADGFGGKTRSIHFARLTLWPGCQMSWCDDPPGYGGNIEKFAPFETVVLRKRVVKTGEYFPPHSGYDSYTGEYDYEAGGLADQKTHVILVTEYGSFVSTDVEPVNQEAKK